MFAMLYLLAIVGAGTGSVDCVFKTVIYIFNSKSSNEDRASTPTLTLLPHSLSLPPPLPVTQYCVNINPL